MCCYVNDIVIFLKTLKEYLRYLKQVFKLFKFKDLSLKTLKSYIEYLFMILLDQCVNKFKLIITEEKTIILKNISFSENLRKMKIYIRLIEYLRSKISFYT